MTPTTLTASAAAASFLGGINRLVPGAGRVEQYRHATDDSDGLSSNIVTSVFEEGQGVLWIGTVARLDRLDRNSGEWKHYPDPDDPLGFSSNSVEILLGACKLRKGRSFCPCGAVAVPDWP
jgi:ligand-binding sensor domain-containing protein